MQDLIRDAITKIGTGFDSGVRSWLSEKNPMALRQLDGLQDKVDVAALAGDVFALKRACNVWAETWCFWIKNWRTNNK